MVCKPILKLFIRKFSRNLLLKQGFSGFPNERLNTSKKIKEFGNISKLIFKKSQFTNFRANEWKFLNLFYFSKFLGRKLILENLLMIFRLNIHITCYKLTFLILKIHLHPLNF